MAGSWQVLATTKSHKIISRPENLLEILSHSLSLLSRGPIMRDIRSFCISGRGCRKGMACEIPTLYNTCCRVVHTVLIVALIQLPTAVADLSRLDSRARSCQSAASVDKDSEELGRRLCSAKTRAVERRLRARTSRVRVSIASPIRRYNTKARCSEDGTCSVGILVQHTVEEW